MADQVSRQHLYEQLKDLVLEEPSRQGERIDAQRLADAHRVSITPIREILYQLIGERLVEPHPSGGFQIMRLDGRALQELYGWYGQHLLAAIHLLPDPVMRGVIRPFSITLSQLPSSDPARLFERLTQAIGKASGNREFEIEIDRGNDRLRRVRIAEGRLFADLRRELLSIVKINGFDVRINVRRRILAYHRRRVEQAAQIAALMT